MIWLTVEKLQQQIASCEAQIADSRMVSERAEGALQVLRHWLGQELRAIDEKASADAKPVAEAEPISPPPVDPLADSTGGIGQ